MSSNQDQLLIAGALGLGLIFYMSNNTGQVPDTNSAVVLMWRQLGEVQRRCSIAMTRVDEEALQKHGNLDPIVRAEMLDLRRELYELRLVADEAFNARREDIIAARRASEEFAGEEDIEAHVREHDEHARTFFAQVDQLDHDLQSVMEDAEQFGMVNLQYNAVAMQNKSIAMNAEIKVLMKQDKIVQQQFNQVTHVHADEVSQHLHQQNFMHNEMFDERVVHLHGGPPNDFGGGNGPGGSGGGGGKWGMDNDADDALFHVGKSKRDMSDDTWMGGAVGNNKLNHDSVFSPRAPLGPNPISGNSIFNSAPGAPAVVRAQMLLSSVDHNSGMVGKHPRNNADDDPYFLSALQKSQVPIGPLGDIDGVDNGPKNGFTSVKVPGALDTSMTVANDPKQVQLNYDAIKAIRDINDGEAEVAVAGHGGWRDPGGFSSQVDQGDGELKAYAADVDGLVRAAMVSGTLSEVKRAKNMLLKNVFGREINEDVMAPEDEYARWMIAGYKVESAAQYPGYRVWRAGLQRLEDRIFIMSGRPSKVGNDGAMMVGKVRSSQRSDMVGDAGRAGFSKKRHVEGAEGGPNWVDVRGGLDDGTMEHALNSTGLNDMTNDP